MVCVIIHIFCFPINSVYTIYRYILWFIYISVRKEIARGTWRKYKVYLSTSKYLFNQVFDECVTKMKSVNLGSSTFDKTLRQDIRELFSYSMVDDILAQISSNGILLDNDIKRCVYWIWRHPSPSLNQKHKYRQWQGTLGQDSGFWIQKRLFNKFTWVYTIVARCQYINCVYRCRNSP